MIDQYAKVKVSDAICEQPPERAERSERSRRRVLSVAWLTAPFGGAHKYVEGLARSICSVGGEFTLAVNTEPALSEFKRRMLTHGARVVTLPFAENPVQAAKELDRLLEDLRPNIVHFNSASRRIREVERSMRSWNQRSFKAIYTMHAPLMDLRAHSQAYPWFPKKFLRYWRERRESLRFAGRFDRILSVSNKHAVEHQRALGLSLPKLTFIPNGVDTQRFVPTASGAHVGERIVIGSSGGLVVQKSFDVLIRAIRVIKDTHPNVQLKLAGAGPLAPQLKELAEKLGLSDDVEFLGHVNDIPGFLQQLDVFALTSSSEAFPFALLEAMSCGLPSVVTEVGDTSTMVRDGIDGYVVPSGDFAAVARRLSHLLADPTLRRKMAANARERVCSHFEERVCWEQTMREFAL